MTTYILKSHNYYKIGKTKNLNKRLQAYHTHNPIIDIILLYEEDIELLLHIIFCSLRFSREWYILDENSIEFLKKFAHKKVYNSKITNLVDAGIISYFEANFITYLVEINKVLSSREISDLLQTNESIVLGLLLFLHDKNVLHILEGDEACYVVNPIIRGIEVDPLLMEIFGTFKK